MPWLWKRTITTVFVPHMPTYLLPSLSAPLQFCAFIFTGQSTITLSHLLDHFRNIVSRLLETFSLVKPQTPAHEQLTVHIHHSIIGDHEAKENTID
jgi:hypothetical protein